MSREDGHVPLELALGAGLLLLPIAILSLSFPTWVERLSMAEVAAQEAARAVVLGSDVAAGQAAAGSLLATTAANHDVPADDVSICWSVHPVTEPPPADCTGLVSLPRGSAVTAHVTVTLPALSFPGLGTRVDAVSRTVVHTERIDRYRSFP